MKSLLESPIYAYEGTVYSRHMNPAIKEPTHNYLHTQNIFLA